MSGTFLPSLDPWCLCPWMVLLASCLRSLEGVPGGQYPPDLERVNLSEPQFPHLPNDDDRTHCQGLL